MTRKTFAHCNRPPTGWWCARPIGHDGPCPAWARWWNLKAPRDLRRRWL